MWCPGWGGTTYTQSLPLGGGKWGRQNQKCPQFNVSCFSALTLPCLGTAVELKFKCLWFNLPPLSLWAPHLSLSVSGSALWPAVFSSHFPSSLSLSAHVSSSLPWVWSLIMLTFNEKLQHCGNHIAKECQHLPGLGHAGVRGLSLCGHCWPGLKGVSQSQPHPHPWGPTPLILCRPLSVTTSRLL